MKRQTICMLVLIALTSTSPTHAETEQVITSKAKPVYAAMFKNGYGLIVADVELKQTDGLCRVSPLPEAVMGSFWLTWPDSVALTDIKATQIQTQTKVPASSIKEILEANIGKKVGLYIKEEEKQATIIDVPKRSAGPIILPREENVIPLPPPAGRGDIVIIETDSTRAAIPISWINAVMLPEGEGGTTVTRPKTENAIEFTVTPTKDAPSKPITVQMVYLTKGISWNPSYVVDISDPEKARISAKSIIINDLMPFEDTDVELIAGYPHIQFKDETGAFSLQARIIFDRSRSTSPQFSNFANVRSQMAVYEDAPAPSMPSSPVMGEGTEDLYFYPIDNVTLKKGERGYYPMFAAEIPYKHIYTWSIPSSITEESRRQPQNRQQPQVVWHSLKLTNQTGNPWTTAPAMTMKDGRILGQDTIRFTPHGATNDLKITHAVSVNADQNEYEISRDRNNQKFYGYNYDLVTVRGELLVTNYKDKSITLQITKNIQGEVLEAEGEPVIQKMAQGLQRVNPNSQLKWTVDVKPGNENKLKIEYTYLIYIRS